MKDISHILSVLNEVQYQAVTTESRHTLLVAGAGSGKTRVLVHRIAWLIEALHTAPWSILAVTFTNKAAREMRGRIEELLKIPVSSLWVGTFHGLAHRLLRQHWQEAGLPQNFQIIDSDDQIRLLRRVVRDLQFDESRYSPKELSWFINAQKDRGLRAAEIDAGNDPYLKGVIEVYLQYEQSCQRSGLVDFAELLLRVHRMWLDNPELLQHYRSRFRFLLVDEFQDTNTVQYAWLRLLCGDTGSTFIVGDDDQSIYGWRGAEIENIRSVQRDFPAVETLRLEQNYRSSGNILAAANTLIEHNNDRLGKELWTDTGEGEPIQLYSAWNDIDEARFVISRITQSIDEGEQRSENAILYRSNAQSRLFEEALLAAGIPYHIHGGLRFFQRAEIKDALGYLRLVAHRDDDAALERIINTPTRGIGERTLEQIRQQARSNGRSLWQAAQELSNGNQLTSRARNAVQHFLQLIDGIDRQQQEERLSLSELVTRILEHSTLLDHFRKQRGEQGETRVENLEELVSTASRFTPEDENASTLDQFLAQTALEAGETQAEAWEDCVQLMTIHSAKGLEFTQVFLCGMEEGLFPHTHSAEEPDKLEEERRLCYVGITRARKRLTLTHAESRRLYGREQFSRVSRFVRELPSDRLQEIRLNSTLATTTPPITRSSIHHEGGDGGTTLQLGQQVAHARFGEGTVLRVDGSGPTARIQVNFPEAGTRWLVAGYANLQPT